MTGHTDDAVIEISALRAARVVATIPLTQGVTGEPAGEVRIDNPFDAYGPAVAGSFRLVLRFDRTRFQLISNNQVKEALPNGALPLDEAVIAQNTTGELPNHSRRALMRTTTSAP